MSNKKDVFSTFEAEVDKKQKEMISEIEEISVEKLKSEGVMLSFGGKTFTFTDMEVTPNESVEKKLRDEFRDKLNTQQKIIREKINSKINQLLVMHQNKMQEHERTEKILKEKYSQSALMPDIKESHLLKGLSVYKGPHNDELIWSYKSVYNPKFIITYKSLNNKTEKSRKILPYRLIKGMKSDIFIFIYTKKSKVTSIRTKKLYEDGYIDKFNHYHQQSQGDDCWGTWKYGRKWETPDDILKLAMEAEAILETINHGSIAERNPSGMPKLDTIINAVKDSEEVNESQVREVATEEVSVNEDVWQTL